ncbi:MAG: glycerol-3-phosphate acyltransferase [Acidimicrobiales bacterium]
MPSTSPRRARRRADHRLPPATVLAVAFGAGAIPFSGVAARLVAGVDLRRRGTGTVSGTGLYDVAGFGPLAVAGSLDVAKGALGPVLAGRDRPFLAAASAGAAVAGHNWSPWLGGAGGRGISPALGATLVTAPEGTVLLGAGLAGGRLLRQTGLASFAAIVTLVPVLWRRRGAAGLTLAVALAVPMLGKRLLGNSPPQPGQLLGRLLFDRDSAPGTGR